MSNLVSKTNKLLKVTQNRTSLLKKVFKGNISWFEQKSKEEQDFSLSKLSTVVDYLPAKQRRVVMLFYGLHSTETFTAKEISQLENMTSQEVQELIDSAIVYMSSEEILDKIKFGKHIKTAPKMDKDVEKEHIIEEVNFSTRTLNLLKRANLNTVEEVLAFYEKNGIEGFKKMRGQNTHVINELQDFINYHSKNHNV